MVANQSGINTILSFGAKSVNPEILEKLLIGRQKAADYLYEAAKAVAENGINQHILVVGQRGMGKTHLLRVLFHRIQPFIMDKKIVVAYFSEEEYGIASYFDFLVRILNSFLKWNDEVREIIKPKITELQNTPFSVQTSKAEEIIEEFCSGKPLLILAENFSDILAALNTGNEQGRLRSWLYTSDRVSIIATSQALSNDFDKENRPFFGFFTNYYLKNLTFPESLEFLIQLSILDNKEAVTSFLKHKGRSQIKALYEMVKGNHRLLVTFYEFLKTDTLAKLSTHFIKTINDLKPYYESFIRYLPPQQQKILRYIALSRKAQNGTEICKNCFIEQRTLSKQISELTRKGLVEAIADPTDGRNKLYDINEPLLRISIEVGEHREGITALFVDFLAIYYSKEELAERKVRLFEQKHFCANENDIKEIDYEIIALDRALELKESTYNDLGDSALNKKFALLENRAIKYFENKKYEKSIDVLKQMLLIKPENEIIYYNYGLVLGILADQTGRVELYEEAINKFQETILLNPKEDAAYANYGICLAALAHLKKDEDLYLQSFRKYQKAISIKPNDSITFYNWGTTLGKYAARKQSKDLFYESINKFSQAIEINPVYDKAFNNLGVALASLAELEHDKELFYEGIRNFQKSIEINKDYPDPYKNWGEALYNLALIDQDVSLLHQSIDEYKISYELGPSRVCLEGINRSIIQILKSSQDTLNINFDLIREISKLYQSQFPEFKITEKYIDVFQKYVVEGDEKSIYSLPKEQREFFKREILREK